MTLHLSALSLSLLALKSNSQRIIVPPFGGLSLGELFTVILGSWQLGASTRCVQERWGVGRRRMGRNVFRASWAFKDKESPFLDKGAPGFQAEITMQRRETAQGARRTESSWLTVGAGRGDKRPYDSWPWESRGEWLRVFSQQTEL